MKLLALSALAAVSLAAAQTMTAPMVQPGMQGDQVFVTKAGQGNMFEINAAKLALQMGHSQAVKDFAQRMVTDHTKIGADVNAALTGTGYTDPTTVSPAQQQMLDALKASGAAFDGTYKTMMVQSHYETYTLFQSFLKVGQTPALKTVIANDISIVKMHWDMSFTLPSK